MSTAFEDIDYKNNRYEYPDLTWIIRERRASSLLTLHNEVKSNAISVNTSLDGGQNGHLSLVVTPERYATLVPGNTPYEKPANPDRLQIAKNETEYQIAQQCNEHDEATRLFQEVIGVEGALIQQIVGAVEA